MNNIRGSQGGLTLIELLVSLTLSSIALSVTLAIFHTGTRTALRFNSEANYVENTVKLGALVQQILDDLDSHRFKILPRITNGMLTFADGTKIGTGTKAKLESTVMFNHELCRMDPIILSKRRLESGGILADACFTFKDGCSPPDSLTNSLGALAITPAGLFEVQFRLISNGSPCKRVHLQRSKGLVISGIRGADLLSVSKLAPIRRSYAIFTDSKNNLRFFGFSGDTLIENQPIQSKFCPFKVDFFLGGPGVPSASFSLDQHSKKFHLTSSMERYDFINSLFE